MAPEKGLHVLAEAYRQMRSDGRLPKARLEAAGYLRPEHKDYFNEIEQQLKAAGLGEEFRYHGEVDREQKIAFLRTLDVLSVPATYNEPKGMFLLEAMACGVPVVQPSVGAFTEIVEKTGGGVLVDDDPASLAEGILKLYREPELAERLGQNGFRGVRENYSVARMADRALEVYESVMNQPQMNTDKHGSDRKAQVALSEQ